MDAVREDPGHGGRDRGACGNGLEEADVALEISQLSVAMVRLAGVNVQLTRTRDVTLEPEHRSRALMRPGVSCSVSVHLNSAVMADGVTQDPEPRGYEVFVSAFCEQSRLLGECIAEELAHLPVPPRNPPVKTRLTDDGRDFYYFVRDPVSVGIPAVLVEVGFISNPQDAEALSTFWGRFAAAYRIARGVLAWLGQDPDELRAALQDAETRLGQIAILATRQEV